MGAGVQFKDAWIPACAGMTDRYHNSKRSKILADISGTQHYIQQKKVWVFHQNSVILDEHNVKTLSTHGR
jgi:hypothetical protein